MQTKDYKNCSVRILSHADGKKSMFTAIGKLTRTSKGVSLYYKQEKSLVKIETEGANVVRMLREGDVYLQLSFFHGKQTQGNIGLSALSKGAITVFAERAEVFYAENGGVKIILEYVLRFSPQEERRTSLQLIAEIKE